MDAERPRSAMSGYPMAAVGILLAVGTIVGMLFAISREEPYFLIPAIIGFILALIALLGLFIVNPNDSRVLVLFGTYKGTVKTNGFFWANPLLSKKKITLRARNLNGEKLKVNDKSGNPIQIAAVVVWRVADTFRAAFDVDDYEHYVIVQSEAAVRHLAGSYPYDTFDDEDQEQLTLRAGTEQVNAVLERELSERFERAGIEVIEARISHLAYAPEIAEAMLRRQQASAVVAARTQIVNGAVSMVELALDKLSENHVVQLDEERRAAMVSNLLVVLCSESSAAPVVNAGTLYQG
jgi:hypothetical protein